MIQINTSSIPPDFPEGDEKALRNFLDTFIIACPYPENFDFDATCDGLGRDFDNHYHLLGGQLKHLLQVQGLTSKPTRSIMYLTEKGHAVKLAGGFTKYLEQCKKEGEEKATRDKLELQMLDTTIAQNEYLYKYRFVSPIVSLIAVLVSVIALAKDCSNKNVPPPVNKENLEVK